MSIWPPIPGDPQQPEFVLVLSEQRARELVEALDPASPLAESLAAWWEGDYYDASGAGWYAATAPKQARAFIDDCAKDIPPAAEVER